MTSMEDLRTRRVQRLDPKPESGHSALVSQVFGGHAMMLSKDGWEAIQSIVDLHYMGAAEYEFGALPECLSSMIENRSSYEAWEFDIKGSEVALAPWRQYAVQNLRRKELDQARAKGTKATKMSKKHRRELEVQCGITALPDDYTVYVVSHLDRAAVEKLIRAVASDKMQVKNGAWFDLDPDMRFGGRKSIGWLDLDNELVWFLDKDTQGAFSAMLGIESVK